MRRNSIRGTQGLALLCSLAFVVSAAGVLATEPSVDLSGDWQLDPTVSDDLSTAMREARSARRGDGGRDSGGGAQVGRGGGGRGGFGGGPGGGRGRGRGRDDDGGPTEEQREAMRARREALVAAEEAARRLEIRQVEGRLTVLDATGAEHAFPTDGSRFGRVLPDGRDGESSASWKKRDHLVVESEPVEGRGSLIETYALGAEGSMLVITTEIRAAGRRGKVEIRRIYRRAQPGA